MTLQMGGIQPMSCRFTDTMAFPIDDRRFHGTIDTAVEIDQLPAAVQYYCYLASWQAHFFLTVQPLITIAKVFACMMTLSHHRLYRTAAVGTIRQLQHYNRYVNPNRLPNFMSFTSINAQ